MITPSRIGNFLFGLAAAAALPMSTVAVAEDWPNWMGPHRNNTWRADGILQRFPDSGPKIVWRSPVSGGYAGPAVAGGKLFLTDYVTGDDVQIPNLNRQQFTGIERVLCLDVANGRQLWKHEYPVKYTVSYPSGPRCTPAVDQQRVYFLGAEGMLLCMHAETGQVLWKHDLPQRYQTKAALWGYAGHPLVDGDKLICTVGGHGSHTVAFNKVTGAELWRYGTATEQGYSPPSIIEFAGKRQLILMSPDWIASVNPENGQAYWTEKYEANNGSIIMQPVRSGRYLYVGGFNKRSLMLELDEHQPAAKVLWRDKAKMAIAPVNVQPLVDDDVMYGFDTDGDFMAVQFPDGNRLWSSYEPVGKRPANSATAFIVRHQDRYFLFAENGDLIIGQLSKSGFTELDRANIIQPSNRAFGRQVVWCAPALADQRLYVRNDKECICVDLSAQ